MPPATFQFDLPGNATTCSSFTIYWRFTGEHVTQMTLLVTNNISHPNDLGKPLRTLTFAVPSDTQEFIWAVVDIEEGEYHLNAMETITVVALPAQTTAFFVKNSSDVSCLGPDLGTVLSSHRTKNGTSQAPHHRALRHIGTNELVGIILGGFAGLVLLAVAFIFPRLWRHALPSPKTRRQNIL